MKRKGTAEHESLEFTAYEPFASPDVQGEAQSRFWLPTVEPRSVRKYQLPKSITKSIRTVRYRSVTILGEVIVFRALAGTDEQ